MPTQEKRLTALEQKVADIELERLYEKRKASVTPSEEAYDAQQVNQRLTILLGITSGQEHDITSIKQDVSTIKGQLVETRQDINAFRTTFEERFTSLEGKFDQLENKTDQRFTSLEGKFDQLVQHLATLTTKLG